MFDLQCIVDSVLKNKCSIDSSNHCFICKEFCIVRDGGKRTDAATFVFLGEGARNVFFGRLYLMRIV